MLSMRNRILYYCGNVSFNRSNSKNITIDFLLYIDIEMDDEFLNYIDDFFFT